tara:strand:- start:1141 stop:1476 length:336 start_codon:yes stop_codon:yes gene_type:complete
MKVLVETVGQIEIYFEAVNECLSLSELLPDHTDEEICEIEQDSVLFMAKVTASLKGCGIEGESVYLGGCIYDSEEDFYIRYKDEYFSDMKDDAINNLNNEIIATKKILENH